MKINQPKILSRQGKKISRRQFFAYSAAGLALTACTSIGKPGEEAVVKSRQRSTTWPPGEIPRERTLVYSYSLVNGTLAGGIHNAFSYAYSHQFGNAVVFEPCAFYSVHSEKTYLWLAESYHYNRDATILTIKFRKGIKWSDGTPFTANDAAWSMEALKRVHDLNRSSTYKSELERTEVVDERTLKIYLKQPDFRFFFKSLTFRFDLGDEPAIQPSHIFSQMKDWNLSIEKFFNVAKGWPVSTGPYGVSVSTDQQTWFDLRPTWWAVETGFVKDYPDVWRISVQPFTSDTLAAQQLINNEIDQSIDLRPSVCKSLLDQAGDHVQTWGSTPPYGYIDWWPISVQFCTMKPPFDDPRVRWAVAYAIDQQKVVDIGWGGVGKVAYSPFPEFKKLNEYMDGIQDITAKYNVLDFNLEKSAALMAEAGFTKDAEGFWVDKNGKRPDADLYAPVPLFGDIAPIVVEQLRNAGFAAQHRTPPDVWEAMMDGRASIFLFGHCGAVIDPYDTFLLYDSTPRPMGEEDWLNITRWSNADFRAITAQMNTTAVDSKQMKDLFHKGMEIWYRELPDCPLVQWYHRIPVNTAYWANWPTAENPYMNSALWHLTALIVVSNLKAKM